MLKDFTDFNFWEMILRTTFAFIAILVLARFLGKKQLSQLTFFHYVTGITLGSIAAEIAGQRDTPFTDGMISLVWWTVLTMLASFIALKSTKIRILLDDEPAVIIRNGVILEKSLRKARLHMDDVTMMLREQSVFSLQDVQYAVFETNGELSVMKKPAQQGATKQDTNTAVQEPKYMPSEIISDGKLVEKNLIELDLTEDWLMKKLRKKGIQSIEDVYFAQVQEDGSLFIDKKNEG